MTPTETTELAEQTPVAPEMTDSHAPEDHAGDGDDDQTHQAASLNPDLVREISVEVPADEVSRSFRDVTKRFQKMARIPGFRSGKVPESVIRGKFMKEIRQEILDGLVSRRFRQAIEEQKIMPISQPQIQELFLADGQPLRFKAVFEVLPQIDLAGYDSVAVPRPDATLSDEEYAAELDRALEPHATVETVEEDRPLVDRDWAEIKLIGNKKVFSEVGAEEGIQEADQAEPITGEDVLIEVGGKNTLGAFNDALRGSTVGQELEFEVTYPADFGEPRLAGQTVSYDVTVKAIKKKTLPERDAEFAKQLGNYESWEDFEEKLRQRSADRKKDALENQAKDRMLEELIGRFVFPVPETFVQQQVDARLDRGLRALAQQGMSSDDMRKLDFSRLRAAQRDQAMNEVKASLILDRIAEIEGVTITDEEVDREILLTSIRSREPYETMRERMQKDGGVDRMKEQMRREKTGSVLFEKLAS